MSEHPKDREVYIIRYADVDPKARVWQEVAMCHRFADDSFDFMTLGADWCDVHKEHVTCIVAHIDVKKAEITVLNMELRQ